MKIWQAATSELAMDEQEIADVLRAATRSTPSPEMLRRLEREIAERLTPTVTASLDVGTGQVTVRVGPPKHSERGHAFIIKPTHVVILHEDHKAT